MSEATIESTAAGQNPGYINRELSWLRFNERVLAEAENRRHPLLERLKYLAIFESNLDEFFMVRVSGYFEQIEQGLNEETPDGLNPEEQVQAILDAVKPLRDRAAKLWEEGFRASLERSRIRLRRPTELEEPVQEKLAEWFRREIFPLCTPLVLWPNTSFPFLSNRSLNLAVVLNDESGERLARVKVPNGVSRLVPVPGLRGTFVWLEDLLAEHLDSLFPGMEIRASYRFRVIRDADIEIRELEASDLISMVEQTLQKRRFGDPVLLEVEEGMPEAWIKVLRRGLQLDPRDVLRVEGLIGLDGLWEIAGLDRPRLRYRPVVPNNPNWTSSPETLFDTIRERDVLLHMPYDSFRAVETFVASAANDPKVVGIKQTLYRVGSASPIVESLLEASSRGKQVAAMVELKARFDESNNLVWSRALERAGVHVTYGFRDMKVHAKLCVVVRKEKDGLRTYTYIGTGNFNPNTART
ncbi:MAG: polyphosphate kinase 1, partial [Armatimonadota bacterium]